MSKAKRMRAQQAEIHSLKNQLREKNHAIFRLRQKVSFFINKFVRRKDVGRNLAEKP